MRMFSSLFLASAGIFIGLTGAARAVPAVGLSGGTALFSFDTSAPGTTSSLIAISGLQTGESLFGIDYRPATGALYGLGTSGSLYTIDTGTGAAMLASVLSVALSGSGFDIAFNPTVDRLRVVGTSGQDLRVNVETGLAIVDGTIAYAAGDANAGTAPSVVGVAYTNQFAGATTTVLYDLEATRSVLATQSPPNSGTLNTVGALGVAGLQSFDIDTTGVAYAATGSALYQVDLGTGSSTLLGGFGRLSNVTDIAVTQTSVPEPLGMAMLGAGLAAMTLMRRRGA